MMRKNNPFREKSKCFFILLFIMFFIHLMQVGFAETKKSHDKQLSDDIDHYLKDIKMSPHHQYGSYYTYPNPPSNLLTKKQKGELEKATDAYMKSHKNDCKNIDKWPLC